MQCHLHLVVVPKSKAALGARIKSLLFAEGIVVRSVRRIEDVLETTGNILPDAAGAQFDDLAISASSLTVGTALSAVYVVKGRATTAGQEPVVLQERGVDR